MTMKFTYTFLKWGLANGLYPSLNGPRFYSISMNWLVEGKFRIIRKPPARELVSPDTMTFCTDEKEYPEKKNVNIFLFCQKAEK